MAGQMPESCPIGGFRADRNIFQPQKPNLADVRINDGKLLYGFSAEEFTALVILGGFSPAALFLPEKRSATSFLGRMHVMDHSPFTQVAVFDPHHGVSSSMSVTSIPFRWRIVWNSRWDLFEPPLEVVVPPSYFPVARLQHKFGLHTLRSGYGSKLLRQSS